MALVVAYDAWRGKDDSVAWCGMECGNGAFVMFLAGNIPMMYVSVLNLEEHIYHVIQARREVRKENSTAITWLLWPLHFIQAVMDLG